MSTGSGLIIDIIALGVIVLSTVLGARKGFALTVVSFMQWFVCVILGFILCGTAKSFLMDYTELDDTIHDGVLSHIQSAVSESSTSLALPDLFHDWIDDGAAILAEDTAASITSSLMTVIGFLSVVFIIKVICFGLTRLFSRRYNDGITGFLDGFFGFLFGIARGLILLLLGFAVLVPVLSLVSPDLSESAVNAMENSYAASILYDDNMLLILVRDFFS